MLNTTRHCLKVSLPVPLLAVFDYLSDSETPVDKQWIGCRVWVPFGSRQLLGVVTAIGPIESPEASIRPISQRIDAQSIFNTELWQSLNWLARYYQAPLGEVFHTALPGFLREGKLLSEVKPKRKAKVRSEPMQALEIGPCLNSEQQNCVQQLLQSCEFNVHLLEGITGSGKTEVYIQAILDCVQRGKQALILVPEIGLTQQTLARFQARLPTAVHVFHSNLADGERARAWAAMASGEGRVLLGTRSAVFMPLPEPGLMIIDEEHDSSYKQADGIHYHARDVAIVRAKRLNVPIVLGSATPSFETLHNAFSGRYQHHRLLQRAGGAVPPTVRVMDVRKIKLQQGISQAMLDGIKNCLDNGEQALVFKNRRGYAPALLCHDCGFTAMCPRCDKTLTVHFGQKRLHCHHCGYQKAKPLACPDCASLALQPQGIGTERLEQALASTFPDFPCIRVDSQSTGRRNGLALQLQQLGDAPGILVGTQILAKGHDLPKLSFVGIIGVDEGLYSADFRAPEKLAQLLIQVSGRAGRSLRAGEVMLQTHHPDHPLLLELLSGGYAHFAQRALAERELAQLAPYHPMALVQCESVHQDAAQQFLQESASILFTVNQQLHFAVQNSGALPAGMPKRAGKYRWQVLLSAPQRAQLQQVLSLALPQLYTLKSARKVRWSVDVDPIEL